MNSCVCFRLQNVTIKKAADHFGYTVQSVRNLHLSFMNDEINFFPEISTVPKQSRIQHLIIYNILLSDVSGYVHFLSYTCEGKKHDKKLQMKLAIACLKEAILVKILAFRGLKLPKLIYIQPKKKQEAEN